MLNMIRLFSLIIFLCSLAFADDPTALEDLDAILTRHKNLNEFLNDPKSQAEYYEKLNGYMGGKIQRSSYDAILNQLKKVDPEIPGLTQRLWETTGIGEKFSITTNTPTFGRELDYDKWKIHFENAQNKAAENAGGYFSLTKDEDKKAKAKIAIEEIQRKEKSLVLTGNNEQKRNQAALHFKEVRSSPQVKELASYYASVILKNEDIHSVLIGREPDSILNTLKEIKENPRKYLPADIELPGSVVSEIKELLPDQNKLLTNKEIFPEEMRATRKGMVPLGGAASAQYDFIPLPRRFHGIWKGIPSMECVGGSCESLDYLTAQRWATVAIKDSQLHYLEKKGRFSGFVETLPGEIQGKTFATIGFGAPELNKRIIINTPTGTKKTTLYNEWFEIASEKKPANWSGFVVSDTYDLNNAGNLNTVKSSNSYLFGESVNPDHGPFQFKDPIVDHIAKTKPMNAEVSYSKNSMVADATTDSVKYLVQLETKNLDPAIQKSRLLDRLQNPTSFTDTLQLLTLRPELIKEYKSEIYKIMIDKLEDGQLPKKYHVTKNPSLNPTLMWAELGLNHFKTIEEQRNFLSSFKELSSEAWMYLIKNSKDSSYIFEKMLGQKNPNPLIDPELGEFTKEYIKKNGLPYHLSNNNVDVHLNLKTIYPHMGDESLTVKWLIENPKEINEGWVRSILLHGDTEPLKPVIIKQFKEAANKAELISLIEASIFFRNDQAIKEQITKALQTLDSKFYLTTSDLEDLRKTLDWPDLKFPEGTYPKQFARLFTAENGYKALNLRTQNWPTEEINRSLADEVIKYIKAGQGIPKNFAIYGSPAGTAFPNEASTYRFLANTMTFSDPNLREFMLMVGSGDPEKIEIAKEKLAAYRAPTASKLTYTKEKVSCIQRNFKKFLQSP